MKQLTYTKPFLHSLLWTSLLLANAVSSQQVLEEIVVTAQLRAQNLQEVPVAITAFSEADITNAGIANTQDFINLTPNVSLDDSFTYGNTFVSIRGVSQINNADSPVAIVIDGVPQNNQKQFKMQLFDIERIEVLKGPQGSLYGRNAIGGAINIVSKKPTEEVEGFLGVKVGNGGLLNLSGAASGTLIENKLAVRLAGTYLDRDGLIENRFLNTEVDFVDEDYSVRANFLYTPIEDLAIDFRIATSEFEAGGLYDVVTTSQFNPAYRSGDANTFFSPDSNNLGRTLGETDELTLKADWDLGNVVFTAITGYTDLSENYTGDLDFSNPTALGGFQGVFGEVRQLQNLDVELLSQEFRLVSDSDSALQWIVGAFYIETDRQLETIAGCDDDPACASFLELAFGLPLTPPADFAFINRNELNDNKAWSVFGQLDYEISERLTVQFGLRYDKDEREQEDVNGGARLEDDFDAVQPKISISYSFSDNALGYATYSTGFRSGGFNAPGLGLSQFEDEYLQNLEFGSKTTLLDGRLLLNAAVFFSKSDDYQFFFVDAVSAAQFIGNLEEVEIYGLDADFKYLAATGLEIFGGVGFTETDIEEVGSITSTALAASGVDVSRIPGSRAPKNTPVTFNVGAQYRTDLTDIWALRARFDLEHRGKKYWQVDNLDVQDSLNLLGARIGLESESWSVVVWGENLTDEEYYTDYNPAEFSGSATDIGFPSQPRSYGVDVRFNF
ncbi:MAG: TonB-dependent receptor [Halioglobus sp.]